MPNTTTAQLHRFQSEPATQPPRVTLAAKKHWVIAWPGCLVWILSPLLALVIYWQSTYVSGIELNTHTWEQRSFSFHRDPFTGRQISGVKHNEPVSNGWWSTTNNPNSKKIPLAIGKYLPKKSSMPLRWDLVRLEGSDLPGGAASILVQLLDAVDRSYREFWPQWSSDNPRRAAIVWPAAHRLVELGRYAQLPTLLDLALLDNSLSELEAEVGQLVQVEPSVTPGTDTTN